MSELENKDRPEGGGGGGGVTCAQVRERLLAARRLDQSLAGELESHLASCEACRARHAELVLLDEVARAQAPALPEGFELALRRRLQARAWAAAESERGAAPAARRLPRLALAAVAAVLLAVGALLLAPRWTSTPRDAAESYHRLRLSIESAADLAGVHFTLELPDGVRLLPATFAALGTARGAAWRSEVRKGLNEIDLPLVARQRAGVVRIALRAQGRTLTREVRLEGRSASRAAPLLVAWVIDDARSSGIVHGGQP
jgi:hypothetical protein